MSISTFSSFTKSIEVGVINDREDSFSVLSTKEFDYSYIVFLKTPEGKEFVLKQIKNPDPEEQIQLVAEVIAAKMAHELEIPIASIQPIAKDELTSFRPLKECPAMLLSKAKGVPFDELPEWSDLVVAQRFRPINSTQYKKRGPLPKEKEGLTVGVLESMSRHSDLPSIVALDTFVGNNDRFANNLFYDHLTSRFEGIDLGESFKYCLMPVALEKLKEFSTQPYRPTFEFIQSIKKYRETLFKLQETWPQQRIETELEELSQQYEFDFQSSKTIERYKANITMTFRHIDAVLTILKSIGT